MSQTYCALEIRGTVQNIKARTTHNGRGVADLFIQWERDGYKQYTPVTLWHDNVHMIRERDEIILHGIVKNVKKKRRDGSEYWVLEAIAEQYEATTPSGRQYTHRDRGIEEPSF